MKIRKLVALIIAAVFVCVLAVSPLPVKASADTSPPKLISCTPAKAEFKSGEDVVFYIKAFDESGINFYALQINLINTNRNDDFIVTLTTIADLTKPEESEKGIYTYKLNRSVNDFFDTGDYTIDTIWLEDNTGLRVCYYSNEIKQNKIHVNNTVRTDFTGPKLLSVNMINQVSWQVKV
jgi:hypothetical protein